MSCSTYCLLLWRGLTGTRTGLLPIVPCVLKMLRCALRARSYFSDKRTRNIKGSICFTNSWYRGAPESGGCPDVTSFCSSYQRRLHSTQCHSAASSSNYIEHEGVKFLGAQVLSKPHAIKQAWFVWNTVSLAESMCQRHSMHSEPRTAQTFAARGAQLPSAGCRGDVRGGQQGLGYF